MPQRATVSSGCACPGLGDIKAAMKVLLARPHDFIVALMREAMVTIGHEPVVLERLERVKELSSTDFAGSVISLAATSTVPATPAEVFAVVRKKWPTRPIVFSGLSSIASARGGLSTELKYLRLRTINDPIERSPEAVLYITDVDLKHSAQVAQRALRAHLDAGSLSSLAPVR